MPINKTLYVRDEDAGVWEEAKNTIQEPLSQLISNYLRTVIATKRGERLGYERIVLNYNENGAKAKSQAFSVRWIFPPQHPWATGERESFEQYAVAVTAKGNIVFFHFGKSPLPKAAQEFFSTGFLHVFDSWDRAAKATKDGNKVLPRRLVAEAMQVVGVVTEELDI
jgi:hypothetical protein